MTAPVYRDRPFLRWLRDNSWRHLLLWCAVAFALFPILFVISAAGVPSRQTRIIPVH